MDLWIRSQDKSVLIKCECLHLESSDKDEIICANQNCLIGKYKKERALQVLDVIQNMLHNVQLGYEQMTIYEMPQE